MRKAGYLPLLVLALTSCAPSPKLPSPAFVQARPSVTDTSQEPIVYVDEPINLRTGPGVVFEVTGQITPGHTYDVVGKHLDWWLIDIGGGNTGWIYAPVYITNFIGDAETVPDLPSPPTPSPEPTPICPSFPPTPPAPQAALGQARLALTTFFTLLSEGSYAEAAPLYSGEYDTLRDNNPLLDPEDLPALLKHACEINGYQCLAARYVAQETPISDNQFEFLVEFSNRDGSLFVRGPCCGASEEDMPSQSQFLFHIVLSCDGKYSVTELPVYVP